MTGLEKKLVYNLYGAVYRVMVRELREIRSIKWIEGFISVRV